MGKKDGMYLYNDWLAPFEKLEKAEVGELVIAMMKYSISGEEPPRFQGLLAMAADFIFPQIDRSKEYARLGSRGGIASKRKADSTDNKERQDMEQTKVQVAEIADMPMSDVPFEYSSAEGETEDEIGVKIEAEYTSGVNYHPEYSADKKKDPPVSREKGGFSDADLYEKQMFENRFNKFWRNYPRKVERQRAYGVFKKLCPDDVLLDRMIKAIEEQKKTVRWKKDEGQYIPYPANWLEGRRWEDEVKVGEDDIEKLIKSKKGEEKEKRHSSFDTDDFFEAALRRSQEYMTDILDSDDLPDGKLPRQNGP